MPIYVVRGINTVFTDEEQAKDACHIQAYNKHLSCLGTQEVYEEPSPANWEGGTYSVPPDRKSVQNFLDSAYINYKHDMDTGIDTYYLKEELDPDGSLGL